MRQRYRGERETPNIKSAILITLYQRNYVLKYETTKSSKYLIENISVEKELLYINKAMTWLTFSERLCTVNVTGNLDRKLAAAESFLFHRWIYRNIGLT